jgi:transcriptional regulator GlxA family with amidase domain
VRTIPLPAFDARRPAWLLPALEVVHARAADAVGLGSIARWAGLHPAYFARAFRAWVGVSVGEYVRRLRVGDAAERLLSTDLTIADIAASTGFADQSHLTRVFRRAMGVTPARYRERNRAP